MKSDLCMKLNQLVGTTEGGAKLRLALLSQSQIINQVAQFQIKKVNQKSTLVLAVQSK